MNFGYKTKLDLIVDVLFLILGSIVLLILVLIGRGK